MISIDRMAILFNQDLMKKKSEKLEINCSESMAQYCSLESTSSISDDFSNESSSFETILVFYRDYRHLVKIDANLSAIGFCNLMTLKLGLNANLSWFLVLQLPLEKIEFILEDWEKVLSVYKRFSIFNCELILKQGIDTERYEFFENWSNFFLSEIISFDGEQKEKKKRSIGFGSKKSFIKMNDIQTQLNCFDKLRIVVSSQLTISSSKLKPTSIEASFNTESGLLNCVQLGQKSIFHVNKYQFFSPILDQKHDKDTSKFSFYMILEKDDSGEDVDHLDDDDDHNDNDNETNNGQASDSKSKLINHNDTNEIFKFTANSESERRCWLTVLKLSKYGLGEYRLSYQEYKKRREATGSGCNSGYVDMEKGLVLLDYSSKDGPKIINEQKEMLTLIDSESIKSNFDLIGSKMSRSKSNSSSSSSSPGTLTPQSSTSCSPSKYYLNSFKGNCFFNLANSSPMVSSTVQATVVTSPLIQQQQHLEFAQPWFYANMTRDEAIKLLSKYETIDGVFLVRCSSRDPLSYVLSFVYNHRIMHCKIRQIEFENAVCLSLDYGKTKFYDLQQLVEFYQLNTTCLPTKLTHFLVHKSPSCFSNDP